MATTYFVIGDHGQYYVGPFTDRAEAERAAVVMAGKADKVSIKEETDDEGDASS